jgi:hypothetical protein
VLWSNLKSSPSVSTDNAREMRRMATHDSLSLGTCCSFGSLDIVICIPMDRSLEDCVYVVWLWRRTAALLLYYGGITHNGARTHNPQVGHTRCVVRVQLLVLLEDSRTSSCSDSLSLIVSHAIHCWSHKSELRQVLCHGFLATQQRSIDATKNLYIITQQPGLLSSSSGYLSLYSASSLARSAGVLR